MYEKKGIMIDPDLLQMLCCPETKLPLKEAEDFLLKELNQKISEKTLKNVSGQVITAPLSCLLVTKDGSRAYPVVENIPVLLADEAIILKR